MATEADKEASAEHLPDGRMMSRKELIHDAKQEDTDKTKENNDDQMERLQLADDDDFI